MEKEPVFAVIHIGSLHTSVAIVRYHGEGDVSILEHAKKETTFGEEIFRSHHLSFDSIHELSRILTGFCQLLADYGVKEVYPIATTAIREAKNSVGILDLLRLKTGLSFHVADMAEEIYYKFFAIHERLRQEKATVGKRPLLLLDVTSGGLGFTGWKDGRLLFQTNIEGGRLRVLERFTKKERASLTFPSAVRDYFHAVLSTLWPRIEAEKIQTLLLTGFEARLLAHLLASGKEAEKYPVTIPAETLIRFVNGLVPLTVKKLMRSFSLSERQATLLLPTLLLYDEIVRTMRIETITIYNVTFLRGYAAWRGALHYAPAAIEEQSELQVDLARSIALRYGGGREHDRRVEDYATLLFDTLQEVHGLPHRARLLLRMGAILHETGKYVNLRNYPLYTYQLIRGTDIFGITDSEKEIIACISYYYNKDNPDMEDRHYGRLSHEQKIITEKCCAMLRLADSLDQGHSGRLKNLEATLDHEELYLRYVTEDDISLIRWSFRRAAELFSEIFGITPILKRK